MAYRVVILDEAQKEYEAIVAYLIDVLQSPQAAINFMDEFDYQVSIIRENPFIHNLSRMPELAAKGYRTVLVNHYIALYKTSQDLIVVAHIFHQTQDYARLV